MMETENNYFLEEGSPQESLFIPLLVKAREYQHKNPIIKDSTAYEISQKISFDPGRFDGGGIANIGILTRSWLLDKAVTDFICKNPCGVIINLGVGLDTRFKRFDNGKVKWFDLDLPEVISLRRKFFSENERLKFISGSVTDLSWAEEITVSEADKILILAEGILMYLTEEKVTGILDYIRQCFPTADFYFDVVHSYFVGKAISSRFNWGIDKAGDIYRLNQKINLMEHWSIGDFNKNRQSLFFRIMNVLPSTRNRSQILHVNFLP